MKFSEEEIQNYIWSKKENWEDLIMPLGERKEYSFSKDWDILGLSADQILYNITLRKIKNLHSSIGDLELFGIEVPLEKEGDSTIRADFLGMRTGAPGIAIVELKKSRQTEREAFTELLGYSGHINSLFPVHSTEDNLLILIAPLKVRTVREAYLQTLLFDRKNIIAFQPTFADEDDIATLKLKPFVPSKEDFISISEVAFAKRNFDVEAIVWYDTPEFWNPTEDERNPSNNQKENMNRVSAYAAQLMEAHKIHGFVYTQQAWPEMKELLPFTNSLVLVGLNPYKVANDQTYKENFPEVRISKIPDIQRGEIDLADVLTGLNKCCEQVHKKNNYLSWLNMVWYSHLGRIGKEVVETMNLNREDFDVLTDRGSKTWEDYESDFLENVASFNFDVRPTGLIRELYWETTKIDYEYWEKQNQHPIQGDIYPWAVETLNSHHFFNEFLVRMFGDPFGVRDIDYNKEEE